MYVGRHVGVALDLLETDRVEVLRGPQGTLFGKNTICRAINVVTAKPTGETRGHVGVTVGDRYRINVEGSGEVALDDRLAVKASVKHRQRYGDQFAGRYVTHPEDTLAQRLPIILLPIGSAPEVLAPGCSKPSQQRNPPASRIENCSG